MNIGHLLFYTHGRISRKMWWLSQVLLIAVSAITTWLYSQFGWHDAVYGAVLTVLMFWFRINVNIKRLHDHGHTGWGAFGRWLVSEIPVVGWVYGFIVFGCLKGSEGENAHGAAPA